MITDSCPVPEAILIGMMSPDPIELIQKLGKKALRHPRTHDNTVWRKDFGNKMTLAAEALESIEPRIILGVQMSRANTAPQTDRSLNKKRFTRVLFDKEWQPIHTDQGHIRESGPWESRNKVDLKQQGYAVTILCEDKKQKTQEKWYSLEEINSMVPTSPEFEIKQCLECSPKDSKAIQANIPQSKRGPLRIAVDYYTPEGEYLDTETFDQVNRYPIPTSKYLPLWKNGKNRMDGDICHAQRLERTIAQSCKTESGHS